MKIYGPVPSRRLGRSLGINHIPPVNCPYACVYCQVGNTNKMLIKRKAFYSPESIIKEIDEQINFLAERGDSFDYVSFVPDGEPTVDKNLGVFIDYLYGQNYKTAVISNSSLIWDETVQQDLQNASWVSLKIDSVLPDVWKKINRPHGQLDLLKILDGISTFRTNFNNTLVTETMIVDSVNDSSESLEKTAEFISSIKPEKAYISVPTRPPVETWVRAPSDTVVNAAFQIFSSKGINTELIIQFEGSEFFHGNNLAEDILKITAVHPMRGDTIDELLDKSKQSYDLIDSLLEKNLLKKVSFNNHTFYVRALS